MSVITKIADNDIIRQNAPWLLPADSEPMRGWAVVDCNVERGDFSVLCCGRILLDVRGAAGGLWSYHLRHAWGGMNFTCVDCRRTYALAGTLAGVGVPDVYDLERLDESRLIRLTALQCHVLDVSLERDEAAWLRSMDDLKAAVAAEGEVTRGGSWAAAVLVRSELQRRKQITLDLICREHGLQGSPRYGRIFRVTESGEGFLALPSE